MSSRECIFCNPDILTGSNLIFDFGNWVLLLNQHQFLLGVCILVRKSHKEGLTSLSEEEVLESHTVLKCVEMALKKSFFPDWFNYLQTNNSVRHMHFHVIPRYKHPVQFEGEEFVDGNFEGMPIEHERSVSKESKEKLISLLRSNIEFSVN